METKNNENLSFEQALAALETITKALETGTVTLDESLAGFERGINLIRRCNELLDNAERRIKILTRGDDGSVTEADFEPSSRREQ